MSLSLQLYQASLAAGAAVALGGLAAWRAPPGRAAQAARSGSGAALALVATAAWVARWVEAGHLPLFGTWEAALSLAACVAWAALWVDVRAGAQGAAVTLGAAVAAGLLLHGARYDSTPWALTISERSLWVDVHAAVAWAAFAALAANAGLGAAVLWKRDAGGAHRWLAPSLEWGFFLHTAMLLTGAAYRFLLLGRAWGFDPIETMGMVAWASYGTLLHMHFFAQWSGRRLAAWCLGLFLLLALTYRGIAHFPPASTYHLFDIDLRQHVVPGRG